MNGSKVGNGDIRDVLRKAAASRKIEETLGNRGSDFIGESLSLFPVLGGGADILGLNKGGYEYVLCQFVNEKDTLFNLKFIVKSNDTKLKIVTLKYHLLHIRASILRNRYMLMFFIPFNGFLYSFFKTCFSREPKFFLSFSYV